MASAQHCWRCGWPYLSQLQQDLMAALVADPTLSNKALGDRVGHPEGTVKNRLSELYATLGVRTRIELVLYAKRISEEMDERRSLRRLMA